MAASQDWPPFVLVAGLLLIDVGARPRGVGRRCSRRRWCRAPLAASPGARRHLGATPVLGLGLVAVLAAAILVVTLHNVAIPAVAVGDAAIAVQLARGRERPRHVAEVLGVPVLVALVGVAVALGSLVWVWSGPADLLAHLDRWGTAGLAAIFPCWSTTCRPRRFSRRGGSSTRSRCLWG
jgi:hypothetical protein